MKRMICCFLLLCILPLTVFAAEPLPDEIQDVLDTPKITAQEFSQFSFADLLHAGLDAVKDVAQKPIKLLVRALGAALIGSVALALSPQKEWQKPLESLCVLGLFAVSVQPALELVTDISGAIHQWQTYLISFVPVLSGVMLSCGQITQAAVYSGMFLTMATFSAEVICSIALPVVQVYMALNTASGLCSINGLSEGCEVISKAVKWILSGVSLLFGAVLGLQSVLAQNTDNLAMRTGQFLISSSIPVVGSVASDAMSSVLSGLKVLKGSLGFAAIAVLAIDFLPILLQSMGYCIAYYLGGAAAKAFNLGRAGDVMRGMGQAVGLCVSFQVFFFMLVVLTTALMIVTGGG